MNRFSIRILSFAVIAVAWFVAIVLAWPITGTAYGSAFRVAGNYLIDGASHHDSWFTTPDSPSESHDIRLRLINRAASLQQSIELSSRRHAYLPTAFFLAIMLATPLPLLRRLGALLWGLLFLHLYFAAKVVLMPTAYAVQPQGASPSLAQSILLRIFEVLSATSAGWIIPPLLVWFAVAWWFGLSKTLLATSLKKQTL